MNERRELSMEPMARFTCGRYTIERGPGDRWAFTAYPPAEEVKTLDDLESLATVAANAARWSPNQEEPETPSVWNAVSKLAEQQFGEASDPNTGETFFEAPPNQEDE